MRRCQRRLRPLVERECQRNGHRTYLPTIHGRRPSRAGVQDAPWTRSKLHRDTASAKTTPLTCSQGRVATYAIRAAIRLAFEVLAIKVDTCLLRSDVRIT